MNSSVAMADTDRRHEGSTAGDDADAVGDVAVQPFDLEAFKAIYLEAPYYSTGRAWSDYVPAYQYGRDAYVVRQALRFEDIEDALEQGWDAYRPPSRLAWVEARGAVEHAWRVAKESAHVPAAVAGKG
jgi:hypothetical protein